MNNWKAVYCSSSIANYKKKLGRKYDIEKWPILGFPTKSAMFFGMYHWLDYLRFIWHVGWRTVFWCGSDILNLEKTTYWKFIIPKFRAHHFCENGVEFDALQKMGIYAFIRPSMFDKVEEQPICFKPSKQIHAYLCYHKGREKEYGLDIIKRIAPKVPFVTFHIYDGTISQEQFLKDIDQFHVAIRLNKFDGFSEILAHAMLRGQYAISAIKYPHMLWVPNADEDLLVEALKCIQKKKQANTQGRDYWLKELSEPL